MVSQRVRSLVQRTFKYRDLLDSTSCPFIVYIINKKIKEIKNQRSFDRSIVNIHSEFRRESRSIKGGKRQDV